MDWWDCCEWRQQHRRDNSADFDYRGAAGGAAVSTRELQVEQRFAYSGAAAGEQQQGEDSDSGAGSSGSR